MHTIENANGLRLATIPWGAAITELLTPDREGRLADITLGYEDPDLYRTNPAYFGAIVGRCANRIARGAFTLDGQDYTLATNNGPNHLHGGVRGFDKQRWDAEPDPNGRAIRYTLRSPAGDEGYPGGLTASVTYTLTDGDTLEIDMHAETDAPTLCNLAQHAYWNLAGHDAGSIADPASSHEITLFADRYTPVDDTLIPTGALAPVEGTPFDFRAARPIADDLRAVGADPHGYDHNYAVNGEPGTLRPVARVAEPTSGRVLELESDQPGVQFYTGNFLDGTVAGKGGARYDRHAGFCLETQHHPDAIHRPDWPQPVLRPGETYRHRMVFRFTTDKA